MLSGTSVVTLALTSLDCRDTCFTCYVSTDGNASTGQWDPTTRPNAVEQVSSNSCDASVDEEGADTWH